MKFGIIVGSMQSPSNSAKVGRYVQTQLAHQGHTTYTLDLGAAPLPLWGSPNVSGDAEWEPRLAQITAELSECEGFVVISPEYHGMVPASLKNFFLYFNSSVLGHKPAHLIGVSAGTGGAYPIAELRMSSSKNNRLCYTPEHSIVRQADKVLNGDDRDDARSDAFTRKRLDYGIAILVEYAKALGQVRASGVVDSENFGNGM